MNVLPYKGYGRIYVDKPENVGKVEEIIRELDAYEFTYMPEGMVAPFSEYPAVKYTHKFNDLNMDKLIAVCWSRGIHVWVFNSTHNEFPSSYLDSL